MTKTETTETSLKITRTIASPVERVWQAIADPDRMASWFRPGTRTCELETYEFQEGGRFQLSFVPTEDDGFDGPSPAVGTFQSITPPEEVVMAWNWDFPDQDLNEPESRLILRLREVDEGTMVTLVHEGLPSKASVEQHYGGWNTVLPKLDEVLA